MELHQNKPLVSVCIPTYNNARYIGRTIDSIANQTCKNIEIIICDNASTDNTREIVHSHNDKRIRYHRNPKTIHALSNWNLCIELANADFVAIYHSDDVYEPTIVEKELRFLKKSSNVGAVFCLDKIINEKGSIVRNGVDLPREIKNKNTLNFIELFSALLREPESFLVAPTFMAKREVFNTVGFFDETIKFGDSAGSAADTAMWLRIAERYKIGIIEERLIKRRISPTQGSSQYESVRTARANHFMVLDSFLNSPALNGEIEKSTLTQYKFNKFWDDVIIARNYVLQGKHDAARSHLIKLFELEIYISGFKNFKNFRKLMIYNLLFSATILGFARVMINFYRLVIRKPWWN